MVELELPLWICSPLIHGLHHDLVDNLLLPLDYLLGLLLGQPGGQLQKLVRNIFLLGLKLDLSDTLDILGFLLTLLEGELVLLGDDVKVVEDDVLHLHLHCLELLGAAVHHSFPAVAIPCTQVSDAAVKDLFLDDFTPDGLIGEQKSEKGHHEVKGHYVVLILGWLDWILGKLIHEFSLEEGSTVTR